MTDQNILNKVLKLQIDPTLSLYKVFPNVTINDVVSQISSAEAKEIYGTYLEYLIDDEKALVNLVKWTVKSVRGNQIEQSETIVVRDDGVDDDQNESNSDDMGTDTYILDEIVKWTVKSVRGNQIEESETIVVRDDDVDDDQNESNSDHMGMDTDILDDIEFDSTDTEILEDSESDRATEPLEETQNWQGQFITPQWVTDFYVNRLTFVDKKDNIEKEYEQSTLANRKARKIWEHQKFGPEPFKDVDASFAFVLNYETDRGNSLECVKSDLDALKMFLRHMTSDERSKLIQDKNFQQKLDVFYNNVSEDIKEQKLLRNQSATPSEQEAAMPIPVIYEKTTSMRKSLIDSGVEKASEEDLDACGHVSLQVVDNGRAPRRQEYLSLVGGKHPSKNCYYDGLITLRVYKTARSYGDYTFRVSPETKIILDRLVEIRGVGNPLFKLKGNLTETTKCHFERVTGKRIYSTLLRYLYVSYRQMNGTLVNNND
ncbi:hypothetical protein HDU88_007895 [Geranomyces variabilis]|nr:hypothetical protein HDU88_007895 [Geranomyces variabilis]